MKSLVLGKEHLMANFASLTKFIPSLDMEDLGEWITELDSQGRLVGNPYVEYWDVVHRFCNALLDFCDDRPEYLSRETDAPEGSGVILALRNALEREERCPGVLLGYLNNGTVAEWLRQLREIDGEKGDD